MKFINAIVESGKYGEGTIINKDDNRITIKFKNDVSKLFAYPDAFKLGITTKDAEMMKQVNIDIDSKSQRDAAQKKQKEIDFKIQIEELERLANAEKKKSVKINSSIKSNKKEIKSVVRENIAFKCNFCDEGKSDKQVGFSGVCSDEIIKYNINVAKAIGCCSDKCACGNYLKGEITRKELEELHKHGAICYESKMLTEWKALAGIYQKGAKKGTPMKLKCVQPNSLCVLTTRDPKAKKSERKESERYVFGVFLVDETYEGDNMDEGYVTTKSKYRLKLSPKEAHKILFWYYHANENKPEETLWGSGLHRYFKDEQAVQMLIDIANVKKGTDDEALATEFLEYFCQINKVDIKLVSKRSGALA